MFILQKVNLNVFVQHQDKPSKKTFVPFIDLPDRMHYFSCMKKTTNLPLFMLIALSLWMLMSYFSGSRPYS